MRDIEKDRAALRWFPAAWDDYIDNLPPVLAVSLAQALLTAATFWLLHRTGSMLPAAAFMLLAVTPVAVGANLFYIRLARGERASFADIFSAFPVYGRALAVSLLLDAGAGLLAAPALLAAAGSGGNPAGLLLASLFALPAALYYLAFAFSEYAVVERRTGVKESFALSARMTLGWKGRLFPVFLLGLLINSLAPDIFVVTGGLAKPQVSLDLRTWNAVSAALKTLVFLPWLNLALARAYGLLLAAAPAAAPGPDADA